MSRLQVPKANGSRIRAGLLAASILALLQLASAPDTHAAGACKFPSQPMIISLTADGQIYVQDAAHPSMQQAMDFVRKVLNGSVVFVRIDPEARWEVLSRSFELLVQQGVLADVSKHKCFSSGPKDNRLSVPSERMLEWIPNASGSTSP